MRPPSEKTAKHTIQQKDAGRGTAAQAELEEAAPGENTNVSQKPKTKARANLNKAVKKTAQHRSEHAVKAKVEGEQ